MNTIQTVPADIGKLTSLSELSLSNNHIDDIPRELFCLPMLRELRLSHNKIACIPEDIQAKRLEILSLDHNVLTSLASSVFQISSLMFLDVSHNMLQELPPNVSELKSLTRLNVNNNSLFEVPPSIGTLSSLEYLLLYNNNLTTLPTELAACSQLLDLGLGGNELPSIYNLGTSAVLAHLREGTDTNIPSPPVLHDWEINFHELEFGSVVGEGAFGQVFEGRWRGHMVAIKQLFTVEEKTLREFRREVGMLSKLKPHKHLVRYFGACTQPPHLYIITEYVARGSLHDLLHASFAEISPALRMKLAQGAVLGCHCLMSNDPPMYHCDLKSKNLLITADWNVKLGDFGQSTFDRSSSNSGDFTYVRFAAPEILKRSSHSEKSEVYSFGVILWELSTRKIPFQDQDPQAIKDFVQNGGRLEVPMNCTPAYAQLIRDCWQEDPLLRPSFMDIYLRLKNMEVHNSI